LNDIFQFLYALDPAWVYTAIFLVAYAENIFPPIPGDVMVVVGGTLVALEKGNAVPALLAGTAGSTFGFMTMYFIGRWFGHRILERGRIKFLPIGSVHTIEAWFRRWGYWIIVANRFLAGTRAVISFFAGISELDFAKTTALSFAGSLCWYALLLFLGYSLGQNWDLIGRYLSAYSWAVTGILVLAAAIFIVRYIIKKKTPRENNG